MTKSLLNILKKLSFWLFIPETRILITSFVNFLNLAMEFELIQSDL